MSSPHNPPSNGFPPPVRQEQPAPPSSEAPAPQRNAPPPNQAFPSPGQQKQGRATNGRGSNPFDSDLSTEALLESVSRVGERPDLPESGFRRFLYNVTGGRWNPGISQKQMTRQDYIKEIRTPLESKVFHVMVWSQKGGVGKTTTTTALGTTTARHRTDKVLGIDVNPDGGSLALRVPQTTKKTILDLRDAMRRGELAPVEFDGFVNHASHRFDTIVMPPGEKPQQPLSSEDHTMIVEKLHDRYPYRIVFTDCGTDLSSDVMDSVFAHAHQLIVVTTTIMDEATVTAGGLKALWREGQGDLVANAITVLVEKSPKDPDVAVQRKIDHTATAIREYFGKLTKQVISVPYDSQIRIGDVFDPGTVSEASSLAHDQATAALIRSLSGKPPIS